MIIWKYVAKRISDEFSSPPGLGHWTDAHLLRTWNTLFDFRFERYHDPASMHGNYATFFDYFMTLASHPQWTDEEKVNSMSSLLEELTTGRYDRTKFLTMLNKGGYDTSKLELSIASMGLSSYNFHPVITKHCQTLLRQNNYVSCVHEACKVYNRAVQDKSGSTTDGQALMFEVWGKTGNLRLNSYATDSEINEQEGVKFISGGVMTGSRNPTAHEPALDLPITFEECVEVLAMVSFLFRKLDKAKAVKP